MKGIFAAIIVLVLLGGGYWFYTQQNVATVPAPVTDTQAETVPVATNPDTDTPPAGAAMETGTINSTTTTTTVIPTPSVGATAGAVKEFTVEGKNFAFIPATMTVKKGDTVKITLKNTGGFHDLRVEGYNVGTKQIQSGVSETVTFVADKAGKFEYYCTVGSHRAMGMKGTLTVQ